VVLDSYKRKRAIPGPFPKSRYLLHAHKPKINTPASVSSHAWQPASLGFLYRRAEAVSGTPERLVPFVGGVGKISPEVLQRGAIESEELTTLPS
jgi:hypothetical protein